MKLKYRILEKLHSVSNSEMDLLVWAVQHSDEASGTMYGAYYKDYHDAASGYVPKAGDIIIFGNGMSHTGIVTGYNPETKKLTTIEGNSGRSSTTPYHKGSHVKEHTYSITYSKIAGYGTPQYPQDDTAADAAGQENN